MTTQGIFLLYITQWIFFKTTYFKGIHGLGGGVWNSVLPRYRVTLPGYKNYFKNISRNANSFMKLNYKMMGFCWTKTPINLQYSKRYVLYM